MKKWEANDAPRPVPLSMAIRRAMDDDRLTDACWNAEMREVYLWENERFWGASRLPQRQFARNINIIECLQPRALVD